METIKLEINDHIATLTFNRPEALNALNSRVFEDLNRYIDTLEANSDLRAVIITGEGKAFVAGADIAEMKDKTEQEAFEFSIMGHDTFNRIEKLSVPVFAAVNGFALGGGLELALACDFIIASDKAKFSAPEANLGLIPGFNGTQRLPRAVGVSNAKYLLFTADMIDAREALRLGLAQKTVSHEELIPTALKIAETIISKGPNAIKAAKKAVNYGMETSFTEGSKNERIAFSKVFDKQGKEGMQAFLEKRKPDWND